MAPLYFLVGCVLATILAYIFEIHCKQNSPLPHQFAASGTVIISISTHTTQSLGSLMTAVCLSLLVILL